jgi:hypothetical protein|nr:MAG TPA: Helix-turn-helix XRE-family like protein [Caudoviricetes sp.]
MNYNDFLGLLIRKLRTTYGLTQRELAAQIDKSEVSIRKYETGIIKIPFAVIFMTVHMLGIGIYDLEVQVNDLMSELKDNDSISENDLTLFNQKLNLDIAKIYRGYTFTNDLEPMIDNDECVTQWLHNQIFGYIEKKIGYKNENNKDKVWLYDDEADTIINDILDYINFKIDKYYNGELNAKKEI